MLDVDIEVDRREFTVAARFRVGPGERLALFGTSGAGKTTVLEVIAGLLSPRRGHVAVAGRTLTRTEPSPVAVPVWRRRVGLLRQDPALFPHLTVRENLMYAPGAGSRAAELAELAARLGLDGLLDARPAALSGGQAHRAALARLLLAHCDALLLDEPYTGLDAASRRQLTMVLRDLVASRGIPAVLVAHELGEAQAFADRIAVLDRGTIIQVATPHEIVLHPAMRRVAELVGYRGFAPVTAEGGAAQGGVAEGGAARAVRQWRGRGRRASRPGPAGRSSRPRSGPARRRAGLAPARRGLGGGCRRGRGRGLLSFRRAGGGRGRVTHLHGGRGAHIRGGRPAAAAFGGGPGMTAHVGEVAGDSGASAATAGLRLRLARQARGYSQQQLAGMAGVSRQAVSAVESGHSDPSLRAALALAQALGMTVEELFGPGEPAPSLQAIPVAPPGGPGSRAVIAAVGESFTALPLAGDSATRAGFLPAGGIIAGRPDPGGPGQTSQAGGGRRGGGRAGRCGPADRAAGSGAGRGRL